MGWFSSFLHLLNNYFFAQKGNVLLSSQNQRYVTILVIHACTYLDIALVLLHRSTYTLLFSNTRMHILGFCFSFITSFCLHIIVQNFSSRIKGTFFIYMMLCIFTYIHVSN